MSGGTLLVDGCYSSTTVGGRLAWVGRSWLVNGVCTKYFLLLIVVQISDSQMDEWMGLIFRIGFTVGRVLLQMDG